MGHAQVSKSTTGPDSPNAHHSPQWLKLFGSGLVRAYLAPYYTTSRTQPHSHPQLGVWQQLSVIHPHWDEMGSQCSLLKVRLRPLPMQERDGLLTSFGLAPRLR